MLVFTARLTGRAPNGSERSAPSPADARHRRLTRDALDILTDENAELDQLGHLLHQSWLIGRELAAPPSLPIDDIYAAARAAGALGGKVLGAGSGGFMLFHVPADKRQRVRERLRPLACVDFDIDDDGSQIVVYEPDGLER